jgi:DNA polymerase I-like protein with 3'-5' exonuclease and polymerase domains
MEQVLLLCIKIIMINRPSYPKQKNVMVINDVPVKSEVENEEKFSAPSNMNLLTSLRTGKVNNWSKTRNENHKGILSTDIFTTYLDYSCFEEGNFDFKNDFKKRKDLQEIHFGIIEESLFIEKTIETPINIAEAVKISFHKLDHQKDIYISNRLMLQFKSLLNEIEKVQPKLIIITGKWALFFLTGCTSLTTNQGNYKDKKPLGGLNKFRSSILQPAECWGIQNTIIVPIFHPVNAMAMPDKVPVMELDLQKLGWIYHTILSEGVDYYIKPDKEYIIGTTKEIVINYLQALFSRIKEKPTLVSIDIETMFHSITDCIGITASIDTGLCIPFAHVGCANFWSLDDETEILCLLREIMLHPNCLHVGQNYSYDCQYFYRLYGLNVKAKHDTMILHHLLYNYLPKDLAFLASLYCEFYTYWKGEIDATKETPETRWKYNVKDICYTLEVLQNLLDVLSVSDIKLQELYAFQMDKVVPLYTKVMNRGVRVDVKRKEELFNFFSSLMNDITKNINDILGMEFNQNSTPQKRKLFSDFFGITLKRKRGGNETCDAQAMFEYIEEYPLYRPFLTLLLEYASLKVFTKNFLGMKLDIDDRARTSYNIAGTSTGRLASRKNAFGSGGNLMNIPEKGKINLRYALEVMEDHEGSDEALEESLYNDIVSEGTIILPNVKKIFLPDEGMELADGDYSGADAMIVAWDSQCKWLMDFFTNRPDEKLYAYIASEHLQREITSKSPEYKPYKAVCHGTNYGLGLDKLATMLGISYALAKDLQDFYFGLCPEIKVWHERIRKEIAAKGYISNIFGRKAWFLNKNDPTLFNKAFAFIPQSSIADLVNHAAVAIDDNYLEVQILLQVHDSLVLQYPQNKAEEYRNKIINCMEIELPYEPRLKIPADIKISCISYGDTVKPKVLNRDFNIIEKRKLELI